MGMREKYKQSVYVREERKRARNKGTTRECACGGKEGASEGKLESSSYSGNKDLSEHS